jgi:hypothetical protein
LRARDGWGRLIVTGGLIFGIQWFLSWSNENLMCLINGLLKLMVILIFRAI